MVVVLLGIERRLEYRIRFTVVGNHYVLIAAARANGKQPLSSMYNLRMCSTYTCISLAGGLDYKEGSVGETGVTESTLILVCWILVDHRP